MGANEAYQLFKVESVEICQLQVQLDPEVPDFAPLSAELCSPLCGGSIFSEAFRPHGVNVVAAFQPASIPGSSFGGKKGVFFFNPSCTYIILII